MLWAHVQLRHPRLPASAQDVAAGGPSYPGKTFWRSALLVASIEHLHCILRRRSDCVNALHSAAFLTFRISIKCFQIEVTLIFTGLSRWAQSIRGWNATLHRVSQAACLGA